MEELLKFLKCISDETRFKILKIISDQKLCVCEITEVLDRSQPCISQHLKKFRELDLVIEERREQWVYYQLNISTYQQYMELLTNVKGLSFESLGLVELKNDLEKVQATDLCCTNKKES